MHTIRVRMYIHVYYPPVPFTMQGHQCSHPVDGSRANAQVGTVTDEATSVGTQRSISIEKDLCVRILSELITFHRKLVELPRDQLNFESRL